VAAYLCYLTKKFMPLLALTLGACLYFRHPLAKFVANSWPYIVGVGLALIVYKKLRSRR